MMVLPDSERIAQLEVHVKDVHDDVHDVRDAVQRLTDNTDTALKEIRALVSGRPSWSVAALITLLSSSTVGLAVALATRS